MNKSMYLDYFKVYESPMIENLAICTEGTVLTGSSPDGSLGELEDNVFGESFI